MAMRNSSEFRQRATFVAAIGMVCSIVVFFFSLNPSPASALVCCDVDWAHPRAICNYVQGRDQGADCTPTLDPLTWPCATNPSYICQGHIDKVIYCHPLVVCNATAVGVCNYQQNDCVDTYGCDGCASFTEWSTIPNNCVIVPTSPIITRDCPDMGGGVLCGCDSGSFTPPLDPVCITPTCSLP